MADTRSSARATRAARASRSSREAFVATTGRLLRRQGYAATGLNEIVALSGAPKGSLYFHFPGGKEQLAVAAMERAGEQLHDAIAAIVDSGEDLGRALASLVDALAAGLEASAYEDGCPIATVTLEATSGSQTMRDAAASAFRSWLEPLERRLLAAGFGAKAAERRALLVLASIEGALILARARRDLTPLAAVRDELVALSG
jgi:TetR/AcrR family transcriptional regulator, lmrAB and yxaGH operons repressor